MDRNTRYIPCLKTTDSELRAFRQLSSTAKRACHPLFELTRSRTTSKNPGATVQRRLENIAELGLQSGFIVDLTTEESLQNAEIEELFEYEDGYHRWIEFLEEIELPNIIPCIQVNTEGAAADLERQTRVLFDRYESVALRLPVTDYFSAEVIPTVFGAAENSRLVLILDCGFVSADTFQARCNSAVGLRDEALALASPQLISCISSSFPTSVATFGDGEGAIPLLELAVDEAVRRGASQAKFIYGDFGLIHPHRYPTRGGTWVPRVDFPTAEECIYRRVRRDAGGYIAAASNLVHAEEFDDFDCWGTEQIRLAAAEIPAGRNPSFWISVRSNIHMERRVDELT